MAGLPFVSREHAMLQTLSARTNKRGNLNFLLITWYADHSLSVTYLYSNFLPQRNGSKQVGNTYLDVLFHCLSSVFNGPIKKKIKMPQIVHFH